MKSTTKRAGKPIITKAVTIEDVLGYSPSAEPPEGAVTISQLLEMAGGEACVSRCTIERAVRAKVKAGELEACGRFRANGNAAVYYQGVA